jgi:hypothetical protein
MKRESVWVSGRETAHARESERQENGYERKIQETKAKKTAGAIHAVGRSIMTHRQ